MGDKTVSEATAVAIRQNEVSIQRVEHSAPLTIEELVGRVRLVEQVKMAVMRDGEHFGTIPGTPKPTLYQPGAQKLGMTFRLHPKYQVDERDLGNGHREYQTLCELFNNAGDFESSCMASCSTMETRYRYRKAERVCPECNGSFIIKGKTEFGGGWLCYAKKGGCGAKFKDGDPAIEAQSVGRAEHDNPADYWNTALKMSQKRAYVGAIIAATGGSDLFTQDIEDEPEAFGGRPPATPAPTPASDQQTDLVTKLMKSHVVTAKERTGIQRRLDAGMTKKQASEAIEWLNETIAKRKGAEAEGDEQPEETGSGALPFDDLDFPPSGAPVAVNAPEGQETAPMGTPEGGGNAPERPLGAGDFIGPDGDALLKRQCKQYAVDEDSLYAWLGETFAVTNLQELDQSQFKAARTWIQDRGAENQKAKARKR